MSTPATVTTLSEFLHQLGAKYRVFDLGRRVVKLTAEQFVSFEHADKPYPYPLQRTAFLGLIFWLPAHSDRQYVWFLKLPLDEQGLLIQASRDEFLVMLLERLGESMLAAADGSKLDGVLQDSPFVFTPREDKMAAFNAQATYSLKLPASEQYPAAYRYFTGEDLQQDWRQLTMQGVADVAVRLDDADETLGLIETLPKLPLEPFQILCSFLEHARPAAGIVEVLAQRLNIQLQEKQPDIQQLTACLRAASNSPANGLVEQMVQQTLKHPCSRDIEVLAIISGRIWPALQKAHLCQLFVEQLAQNSVGQSGFSQLLADLMYLPGMREPVMRALRNPQRSVALSKAVGKLFG